MYIYHILFDIGTFTSKEARDLAELFEGRCITPGSPYVDMYGQRTRRVAIEIKKEDGQEMEDLINTETDAICYWCDKD